MEQVDLYDDAQSFRSFRLAVVGGMLGWIAGATFIVWRLT
jgi:hypothetical protein